MKNVNPNPELSDCLGQLRTVLAAMIRLMDAMIAVLLGDESASLREERERVPDSVANVLPLMLQAMGSSTNTLINLSDPPGLPTRDCFCIARSVVELAANVCFIIAKGPEAADRASRHARQKMFRDLQRDSQIGSQKIALAFTGEVDIAMIPGLAEAINEFTHRSGREKGWIDDSIDDRIAGAGDLGEGVLTALHFARFMIYRHSSEILHGTLFGALYAFGLTQPNAPDDLAEHQANQTMMILLADVLALRAVIEAFHIRYGFESAKERSDQLMKVVRAIPMFRKEAKTPAQSETIS